MSNHHIHLLHLRHLHCGRHQSPNTTSNYNHMHMHTNKLQQNHSQQPQNQSQHQQYQNQCPHHQSSLSTHQHHHFHSHRSHPQVTFEPRSSSTTHSARHINPIAQDHVPYSTVSGSRIRSSPDSTTRSSAGLCHVLLNPTTMMMMNRVGS